MGVGGGVDSFYPPRKVHKTDREASIGGGVARRLPGSVWRGGCALAACFWSIGSLQDPLQLASDFQKVRKAGGRVADARRPAFLAPPRHPDS